MKTLADEQLVSFHPDSSSWEWNTDLIRPRGITDNVAQLMSAKMNRLSSGTIPHIERAAVRLRIGRVLLSRTPPAELEESVFEIVSQFNRSGGRLDLP